MTPELWLAIVGQTIVIVLAVVAAVRHSERRISRCETEIMNLKEKVQPIPGISRALARLEGQISAHRETSGH